MAGRLQDVLLRDTRAAQPVATAVAVGTLYFVTDEDVTEQSDGSTWLSYSGPASTGAVIGPGSAVDDNFVAFDGVSGALVKDSGVSLSDPAFIGIITEGGGLDLRLVSTDGLVLENTTPSDVTHTVQYSPRMRLRGSAWDTSASEFVDFFVEVHPVPLATPQGDAKFAFIINGGAAVTAMTLNSGGVMTLKSGGSFRAGDGTAASPVFGFVNSGGGGSIGFWTPAANDINLVCNSANQILWGVALWRNSKDLFMGWSSNADPNNAVADTAMIRAAAAKIKFYNKPETTPDAGFVLDFSTDAVATFRNRADSAYADIVAKNAKFNGTYYSPLVDDGNSSTALTIDLAIGNEHKFTLTGNVTLTLSNPVAGGRYVFEILTGAGSFTVTWPGTVKWPGGMAPVITTGASKIDLVTLFYDGTNYLGSFAQDFA